MTRLELYCPTLAITTLKQHIVKRARQISAPLRRTSNFPLVAVTAIIVLIATGWFFCLATYELSNVNYRRQRGRAAMNEKLERPLATTSRNKGAMPDPESKRKAR